MLSGARVVTSTRRAVAAHNDCSTYVACLRWLSHPSIGLFGHLPSIDRVCIHVLSCICRPEARVDGI